MNKIFNTLDKKVLRAIVEVGQTADRLDVPAYLVGGFVRDIFLKRKNLDLDIVVEGNAIHLAKEYAQQHNNHIVIYERFKTAAVDRKEGSWVDFATARREFYPHPGALPIVEPGNIADDLYRRDFTINTMAWCINKRRFGELIDEFGGLADLQNKKIRILHEKSFVDDPTRILRAIRFEQRFQFAMEKATLQLLQKAVHDNFPASVKPERYFAEFRKMLEEPRPSRCLVRLWQLQGFHFLSSQLRISLRQLSDIERNIRLLKRKKYFAMKEVWILYCMNMLGSLSTAEREAILAKFNFRKTDRRKILSLEDLTRGINILKRDSPPSQVYRVLKPFPRETILFMRITTPNKNIQKCIDDFLKKYHDAALDIDGHDLKKMGIPEGKRMQYVLNEVLYKKLDGAARLRQDQLKKAKQIAVG